MLTPSVKLWLKDKSVSVIGSGRVELLKAVDKYGSIKKAAATMGMSYRHAWGIIKQIRDSVGDEIIATTRGGAAGGGAKLTDLGRVLIKRFEETQDAIERTLKYGPKPALAVDGVIFTKDDKIVLIRRKNPPFKGQLALPGGFIEYKETTELAVVREVEEELGIKAEIKQLIGVYSEPNRDPRHHTISVVYELQPLSYEFKAGDDAASFELVDITDKKIIKTMAFDHGDIVLDIIRERIK
jgi:8-oxo-dGTP diphosphatase